MKQFILISLLCTSLWASAQQYTQHYKVYNTKLQQTTTLTAMLADVKNADVLFFGEEHNDSIGHLLEIEIYKALAAANNNQVVLTLEMFHTDVQQTINEYLAGIISEKNFIKEARAWNNYKDYRPMVEFAKTNKLPLIGANAAARYSNAVTRNGIDIIAKLPKTSQHLLPPAPIDTLTGRYYEKFIALLGGHSMGGMQVYQSQNFWDATMAWSIAKTAKQYKNHKILQVNGRFHSDEYLGTFAQLKKYGPKLKASNISCFAATDFENPNWASYTQLADYIILTDPTVKKTF